MNTSKVNVAAMLNLLGASGYLERKNDLSDKRVKVLSITAEGYAALDQATEKARLIDAELIAGIDPDRLKVAEDVLNQIKANILKLGDEETASQLYS
jgi:DNA-binding MarR family transcriptional regulator